MIVENFCSLQLGQELQKNNLTTVLLRFKNSNLETRVGYAFEEIVALCNNLRFIVTQSSERMITDRAPGFLGKVNDPFTDINILSNDSQKSVQAKSCKNSKNTERALIKPIESGSAKYSGQIFAIPSDQTMQVTKALLEMTEKANSCQNQEISIWDSENPNLPGYIGFSEHNSKIWNILRYQNALDGLSKAEKIFTPTYAETLSVVQKGYSASFLKKEIRAANHYCICDLSIKNFSTECGLDIYYLSKSKYLGAKEILIRYGKSALSSLITGGLVHQMGLKGIPVSNYLNSALGSAVRAALHCTEAAVCLTSKPGGKKKTVNIFFSNMVEESQRLLVKFAVNYYTSKREDKELSKIC